MTKVAVSGAVVVFLIFMVVTAPDTSADIVHSAWKSIVNIAHGISKFIKDVA